MDHAFLRSLWKQGRAGPAGARSCPMCTRPMSAVRPDGGAHELDVCTLCHVVWFDPDEFEAAPDITHPPTDKELQAQLPLKARELLAEMQLERVTREAQSAVSRERPQEWWKYGIALMGIPVETDAPVVQRLPLVTWGVAGLIVLVAFVTFGDLETAVMSYGLIPADAGRYGGLTFLTSFLLHGGLAHLLGNLYFLIVFGDNVEDYLGKVWFIALIVLASFAGDLLHIAFEPRGDIPSIGASGGISGLIVFYACAFPRARLGFFLWILIFPRWISLPAVGFVAFWIVLQLIGVAMQVGGYSSVSALAHLGGAAVGLAFWFLRGR